MITVNRIASVGIVAFFVVLAGFIGARLDQTTMALLMGVFIALVVAIPTVALVVWLGMRRGVEYQELRQYTPPSPVQQQPSQITTHHHWNITVHVAPGASNRDINDAVVRQLPAGATPFDARKAILEGRVRVVPMLPSSERGDGR